MQKHIIGDKDLGITTHNWDGLKFSDLRAKAQEEFRERGKRKKKEKEVVVPKYRIDDELVITQFNHGGNDFMLVEVVDFNVEDRNKRCIYFGIIKKVNKEELKNRIGRLERFQRKDGWELYYNWNITDYKESDIKWLE